MDLVINALEWVGVHDWSISQVVQLISQGRVYKVEGDTLFLLDPDFNTWKEVARRR